MDLLSGDTDLSAEGLMERQLAHEGCCNEMSLRMKVAGFIVFAVFGFVCCMMGVSSLLGVVTGDVLPFALPYSIGILSLFSASFFLLGPST